MKYIKVDSYGKCLHNKEWPSGDPSKHVKVCHSRAFTPSSSQHALQGDGVKQNDPGASSVHSTRANSVAGSTIDTISQYKFYIAFENANCVDYVTERLVNALHAGVWDTPKAHLPIFASLVLKLDCRWFLL